MDLGGAAREPVRVCVSAAGAHAGREDGQVAPHQGPARVGELR